MAQGLPSVKTGSSWSRFLRESRIELKKVEWPNRQQLVAYTAVTIVTVCFIATMIWVMDAFFSVLFRQLLKM